MLANSLRLHPWMLPLHSPHTCNTQPKLMASCIYEIRAVIFIKFIKMRHVSQSSVSGSAYALYIYILKKGKIWKGCKEGWCKKWKEKKHNQEN